MKEIKRAESIKSDSFKLDVHTYSYRGFWAFTLAEMMVVLLILSIVLAAMAPIMTTRIKRDTAGGLNGANSIWQWSQNNNGIAAYFGEEANQTAMIGQTEVVSEDPPARLIINTSDTRHNHILFKKGNDVLGKLTFQNNSLVLGTGSIEGTNNTASGVEALYSNNYGSNNTAVGFSALHNNTSAELPIHGGIFGGERNTAIGSESLYSNTTGEHNTASGNQALYSNTGGWSNTATGSKALYSNTTGEHNTASGYQALYSNEEGSGNTASGYQALYLNTTGGHNTANGYQALYSNKEGWVNTANGYQALYSNTEGSGNIASGYKALYSNTKGRDNIASGYEALISNDIGTDNIASGYRALYFNTLGCNNIASGNQALYYNTAGNHNTAIGREACKYVEGSNKTCIGASSGPESGHDWAKSTDNTERIFIGSKSKFNDAPAVLEVHNSSDMIPFSKFGNNKFGYPKTAVVINGTLIVKGGIYTTLPTAGSLPQGGITPGLAYVSFIGSGFGSNNIQKIDRDGINEFYKYYSSYGRFYATQEYIDNKKWDTDNAYDASDYSDRRLKYVGKEFTSGLDKIRQLKVFNYTFKKDEKKTPRVGVIAQDLQKIFPNAVKKGVDGFLTIRMEDMFYALVNAVKELDAKVTAMASDFAKQKEQLFSAQKDINALKKENKELKQALNKANNDNKKLEARLNAIEAKLK